MIFDTRLLVAICFVLFFMIIFLLQSVGSFDDSKMLHGFWIASDQFKKEANIEQMVFYLGTGSGYDYKGYVIIVVDGDVVYNDVLDFRITPKGYFKTESFEFVMSKSVNCMPTKLTMIVDAYDGSMTLKCMDSKKIYAVLYKDNQMSANTILQMDDICPDTDNVSNDDGDYLDDDVDEI